MRYPYILLILIFTGLACLTGCKKDTPYSVTPVTGVVFSPITPYQELLPGNVVTFKFKTNIAEPVTSFGIRFLFPGATDYVALPEYPDLTSPSPALISQFQTFEYALPGSATAANATMQFKFTAATATASYSNVYTVKMLSIGLQRARLWSVAASTNFRFSTIDLLRTVAVPATLSTPLTQDMIPVTNKVQYAITGQSYDAISGFTSGNGTKYKLTTAANYALAPTTYAATYAAIAAANELSAVTTFQAANPLIANQYYIAKVNRNGVFSYVGMLIKKSPSTTSVTVGTLTTIDLTQEYIELELKK